VFNQAQSNGGTFDFPASPQPRIGTIIDIKRNFGTKRIKRGVLGSRGYFKGNSATQKIRIFWENQPPPIVRVPPRIRYPNGFKGLAFQRRHNSAANDATSMVNRHVKRNDPADRYGGLSADAGIDGASLFALNGTAGVNSIFPRRTIYAFRMGKHDSLYAANKE